VLSDAHSKGWSVSWPLDSAPVSEGADWVVPAGAGEGADWVVPAGAGEGAADPGIDPCWVDPGNPADVPTSPPDT